MNQDVIDYISEELEAVLIDVICDSASWSEVLGRIKEQQRFSMPDKYNQELIDQCGTPLLIRVGDFQTGFDIHVYPPKRSCP